jgi:hypothetical protein
MLPASAVGMPVAFFFDFSIQGTLLIVEQKGS